MAKLLVGLAPIRCSSSSSANSVAFSAGNDPGVIPCSNLLQTSNNIIQKGLAFDRDWSGTVVKSGHHECPGIPPRRLVGRDGASVVRRDGAINRMEDSDAKVCQKGRA